MTSSHKNRLVNLLKDRSLEIGSFTLSSGKTSTYYIDARRTTMSAAGLVTIGELGLALIREAGWQPTVVGGLTLGADPVSYAIAAASRNAPPEIDAFTVRKEAKRHGTARLVEGCFESGVSVVITEDVVTTGGSAIRAIDAVREAGGSIAGVVAVVDRLDGGREAIESAGFPLIAMATVEELGVTS